jgi:hypothetical protein
MREGKLARRSIVKRSVSLTHRLSMIGAGG